MCTLLVFCLFLGLSNAAHLIYDKCAVQRGFSVAFVEQTSLLPYIERALEGAGVSNATFFVQQEWLAADNDFNLRRVKHLIKKGHKIGAVLSLDLYRQFKDSSKVHEQIGAIVTKLSEKIEHTVKFVTFVELDIGGEAADFDGERLKKLGKLLRDKQKLKLVLLPVRHDVKLKSGNYLVSNVVGVLPGTFYRRVDPDLRPENSNSLIQTLEMVKKAGKFVDLSECAPLESRRDDGKGEDGKVEGEAVSNSTAPKKTKAKEQKDIDAVHQQKAEEAAKSKHTETKGNTHKDKEPLPKKVVSESAADAPLGLWPHVAVALGMLLLL